MRYAHSFGHVIVTTTSFQDKFRGLTLEQKIEKVTIDQSMCKGGVIHFDCVSKLKVSTSLQ